METQALFQSINEKLRRARQELNELQSLPDEVLYWHPGRKKWSAIECIEHLNISYRFYLPRMEQELFKYQGSASDTFRPGLFLRFMIRNLYPKDGRRRMRIRTFKSMQPQVSHKKRNLIFEEYSDFLNRLDRVVERSRQVDLNQIRIASAFGPLLRIKLGDCFPFLLNHDLRHLLQAREAVALSGQLATAAAH